MNALHQLLANNADPSDTRHDMLTADEVNAIVEALNADYWIGKMRETYGRSRPHKEKVLAALESPDICNECLYRRQVQAGPGWFRDGSGEKEGCPHQVVFRQDSNGYTSWRCELCGVQLV